MKLCKEILNRLPVWVNFHNIPVEYWTAEGLSHIASAVGKPLYADSLTEAKKRISYAQICLEIDANKELLEEFQLELEKKDPDTGEPETVIIRAEYPWKAKRCSSCLVFGHLSAKCLSMGS